MVIKGHHSCQRGLCKRNLLWYIVYYHVLIHLLWSFFIFILNIVICELFPRINSKIFMMDTKVLNKIHMFWYTNKFQSNNIGFIENFRVLHRKFFNLFFLPVNIKKKKKTSVEKILNNSTIFSNLFESLYLLVVAVNMWKQVIHVELNLFWRFDWIQDLGIKNVLLFFFFFMSCQW